MGFFKKSDKKNKDDKNSDEENNSGDTTTSPKVKRRASLKRRLSSTSMRKIRELATCLRVLGDEVEQKRLSGAYSLSGEPPEK